LGGLGFLDATHRWRAQLAIADGSPTVTESKLALSKIPF